MKTKPVLFAVVFLIEALSAHSQGTLVVDQSAGANGIFDGSWVGIQTNAPLGQSFAPTLDSIGYVALAVENGNPGSGSVTAYVDLRAGSITGAILGTTPAVALPITGNPVVDFYFPTAISLTPGTTYYFDVDQSSGTQGLINYYSYEYAGGTAFFQGTADAQHDLWFREGIVAAPEPSVAWLALLSGGSFLGVAALAKALMPITVPTKRPPG